MPNLELEFKDVIPIERHISAQGERFTITPFSFIQSIQAGPAFNRIVRVLLKYFLNQGSGEESISQNIERLGHQILETLQGFENDIISIIAIATGRDISWVNNLDSIEGSNLFNAILEVNIDFFRHRVNLQRQGSPEISKKEENNTTPGR